MEHVKDYTETIHVMVKLLKMQFLELRDVMPCVNFDDIKKYVLNVILKNKNIKNYNDLTYHIMNIQINKIIEFINLDALLDKTITIDNDLEAIERK